jgi:hypothetical protein
MDTNMPELNERVFALVKKYSNGNVSNFVEKIKVPHQNLNRCFNMDSRNGKYPEPSAGILISIVKEISDINARWLLTGQGEMELAVNQSSETNVDFKEKYYKVLEEKDKLRNEKDALMDKLNELGRKTTSIKKGQTITQ